MIHLIMGVMGAGKTTVGRLLATRLDCAVFDADDLHPESNRKKMQQGVPLTDEDRQPWLENIRKLLERETVGDKTVVLACSALKERYRRRILPQGRESRIVHLKGSPALIASRIKDRKESFAHPKLLDSQFEALEEPGKALVVDISITPETIVESILASLRTEGGDTPEGPGSFS
jgi:gluconokinase